jgi:hypothetical protein
MTLKLSYYLILVVFRIGMILKLKLKLNRVQLFWMEFDDIGKTRVRESNAATQAIPHTFQCILFGATVTNYTATLLWNRLVHVFTVLSFTGRNLQIKLCFCPLSCNTRRILFAYY